MNLLADRPVQPLEPSDGEALFREAKRRGRKRRFVVVAVGLVVGGIIAAVSSGGAGHGTLSATQRRMPQPRPIDLKSATWSSASVFQADLATPPVALPGTSFAYAIEVRSDAPTSPVGRLVRIDLLNGAVTFGSQVTDAQQMFVLDDSVAILTRSMTADVPARRLHPSPYVLHTVLGQAATLGTAHNLRPLDDGYPVVAESGPLVDGDDFWIAEGDTAYALSSKRDTIVRELTFGGFVDSIAVAPGGNRLYIALNELVEHPTTPTPTIVEELDATTGRVLNQRALVGAELGWATLVAVNDGVWASYRGGMNGTVELLRSSNLSLATPTHDLAIPQAPVPTAGETVGGSISPVPLGGALWLTSATGVSCVLPNSGSLLAGTAFPRDAANGPLSWVPFAGFDGTVYATTNVSSTGATKIIAVRPPTRCE